MSRPGHCLWSSSHERSPPGITRLRPHTKRANVACHGTSASAASERSITGEDLLDELDRIAAGRSYPAVLRCDNGPELACQAMADWAGGRVGLSFIPPGEPWRNGYVESFNSRIREECLNINTFWSLAQARVVISD